MGRRPKQPNRQLEELLEEAGGIRKPLARRVVERGRARGLKLKYDHSSVGRWLSGEQPQSPGPELIAEVLTELLGRKVTPAMCGMASGHDASADLGLDFSLSLSGAVNAATALWRSDVEHRRFLQDTTYAVAVYPAASMRWLTLPGPEHPVSTGSSRRVGQIDVDAVQTMATAFRDLDNKVGGGKVRSTIVQYLHSSVTPLLRGSFNEHIGRQLFCSTAELARLAGWAAYDQEDHGLAQRYLIQALRLARAASDGALSAEIMAAMSHQATYVGRPGDAVDLARAAQIAARGAGLGALESECHMVEAHGHAARLDETSCTLALNAAERAFDRAKPGEQPVWLAYFDQSYISAKTAHCFRELGDNARTAHFAELSLTMSDGYQRGRAFNLSLFASALVPADPREAVRIGRNALEIATDLASRRSLSYLRDLRYRLRPFNGLTEVAEFRQQVLEFSQRG
ncbi:hypothetical protein GFY24_17365 [Nocardia sp. SYP-A9097]|uniref:hypothetical protein n=1 Tax=Nocardia sp. SYP-A9097 TaxID=2663237 RepID=UPI00129B1BCA|nr:hypothetical protein [Nocardia sp. SYP-A9097]MRH89197.1 hypothetical protein [Nocardia sp. SYP-A9097]